MPDKTIFGASYTEHRPFTIEYEPVQDDYQALVAERSRLVQQSLKHADELQDLRNKIAMLVSENSTFKDELSLLRRSPQSLQVEIDHLRSSLDATEARAAVYCDDAESAADKLKRIQAILDNEDYDD